MRSLSSRKVPSTDGLSRDECHVALEKFFVRETLEALGFFSFVAVLRIVAGYEVIDLVLEQALKEAQCVDDARQMMSPQLAGFALRLFFE